ncbi:MAG TPA: hypothetical protein VKT29_00850, partial [Terriglobales bacterium]|nr:hypothetical protein [Terriglobales bacterium]
MARAPPAALPGIPTFVPGAIDITTPDPAALPPEAGAGTGAGPKAARAPLPFFPVPPALPALSAVPPTLGGGGTTP